MILATLFELLLLALVILSTIFEDRLTEFEQRLFLKLKRLIREGKYEKEKT